MAFTVQAVDLKEVVYDLICKERHFSNCTAEQLLKELKEMGIKFEGDRSYEQLAQTLNQLVQEGKIWLTVTNVKVTHPGIELESVEKFKQGLENFYGKEVLTKTVKLVKERLGKDFWSHELHCGERIGYLEDVRWNRNVAWLRVNTKRRNGVSK